MRRSTLLLAALLVFCAAPGPPAHSTPTPPAPRADSVRARSPICGTRCGTERWAVKTLTDSDALTVRLHADSTTITALRSIHAPPRDSLPASRRVGSFERQAWLVHGVVTCWKLEADADFHLVIAEAANRRVTMIAEVPDAHCTLMCRSPVLAQVGIARAAVIAALGKPSKGSCKKLNPPVPVSVVGVGFLDFIHGQTGVAPNGAELHPVTYISFAHRARGSS